MNVSDLSRNISKYEKKLEHIRLIFPDFFDIFDLGHHLKSVQMLYLKAEKTFRLRMIMLGNDRFRSDQKSLQIWNDNSQK